MRIRDLRMLMGLAAAGSAVLFFAAFAVWTQPHPDFTAREIARWQPAKNFASAGSTAPETPPVLTEALARPLFRQARRPFEAVVAEAVAEPARIVEPQTETPPPDASQLVVRGIMINGTTRRVLITTPETPDGAWLTTGADIMGWKIVELGANGVTLSAGQHSVELKLYVDNGPD